MTVLNQTPKITVRPIRALAGQGQSVWLDYIRRSLLTSGQLASMVKEDGLRGVTSNPVIFEKAIAGSSDYKSALAQLASQSGLGAKEVFEALAVEDIQMTADVLWPVYQETKRRDGYISLEVSPLLSHNTQGTLSEARRLWKAVGRENLMIKVPATAEGIPAVEQLISEGINVNVTLIFSRESYEQVAAAYLSGLEKLAAKGGDISKVASVASFFISRIDSAVDSLLTEKISKSQNEKEKETLKSLLGKTAIANAKCVTTRYQKIFGDNRWKALQSKGAQTQRLLWASTGTKNPQYRDVLYVEELIGKDTVNTIPPATYEAFNDHGNVRASLGENLAEAEVLMKTLASTGISFSAVCEKLLVEGLDLFAKAFESLLATVESARGASHKEFAKRQTYKLSADLAQKFEAALKDWHASGKTGRLWSRDASLWTGSDINGWLGWLGILEDQVAHAGELKDAAAKIKAENFSHILLLGMGGSSLCPEVLKMTFGRIPGYPELHVLDSTDPAQIKAFEKKVDMARTLFIVSSKSGSTLEPNIYKQYFFERVKETVGAEKAGRQFIAITDPKSKLQEVAERDHFRRIFAGLPSIGGRFSALSNFGMVPAALMGLDLVKFLSRTEQMVQACASSVPAAENPGVILGLILGVLGTQGRDKVTLITSPGISDLGAWLEQLLAESTGKEGKGLIPVDAEIPGSPEVYSNDRVFVYSRLEGARDAKQDAAVEKLEKAGHPVVRIAISDAYDLGQEFFRWEIATAVAGAILGINPFNQPDVEASKLETRKLTEEYEKKGSLPAETPFFEEAGIKLYTDERNAGELEKAAGGKKTLTAFLKVHFGRMKAGDYFALLAYLEMNGENHKELQEIRHKVRDTKKAATCLGFGPRFLHSTGQAYKGGPNTGVILQLTCDDAADFPVPGQKYTFGVVKAAQARGDFQVLAQRGRRVLRVHLDKNLKDGLRKLKEAVTQALAAA